LEKEKLSFEKQVEHATLVYSAFLVSISSPSLEVGWEICCLWCLLQLWFLNYNFLCESLGNKYGILFIQL